MIRNQVPLQHNNLILLQHWSATKMVLQKKVLKCCYKRHYPRRQHVHLWQVNVYQPFFSLCLFLFMSPCREDDYERCVWRHLLVFLQIQGRRQRQMQHPLSSFGILMKPRQNIKTNAPHRHLLLFFFAL
jgi:hypothetical protein